MSTFKKQDLDNLYRLAAQRLYHKDGETEVEVDEPPLANVSRWDDTDGAYVQAWVWVPAEEVVNQRRIMAKGGRR